MKRVKRDRRRSDQWGGRERSWQRAIPEDFHGLAPHCDCYRLYPRSPVIVYTPDFGPICPGIRLFG